MLRDAVCQLAGESSPAAAWEKLLKAFNRQRGKGAAGYRPGERVCIKVNFVGFIWRWPAVDPDSYRLEVRQDYMNTSPQIMLALLRQLVETVGIRPGDITIGDGLAYFPHEYHSMLYGEYPQVQYLDHKGAFGRTAIQQSDIQIHWSARPEGCQPDFVPVQFAGADYLINLANLKSHTGAGVTLCAKNHYGSLTRWPVQRGYYDLHQSAFNMEKAQYRNLVDLMGHDQIGGKTMLYLIDGLFAGRHPIDRAPMKWHSPPFNGHWTCSLLASQDPVAIDSVAFDFLWTEWKDFPRRVGAEDYLHEAAVAGSARSGTVYDPNHPEPSRPLSTLGVHEHWNNPRDKQYSRNAGTGEGIELVAVS